MEISPSNSILASILYALIVIGMWKLYQKSDEAGWKSLIPIYNLYIIYKIVYGNGWRFLWLFIPIVQIYIDFKWSIDLAKVYGKGTLYGLAIWLFRPIFMIILGFSEDEYLGHL